MFAFPAMLVPSAESAGITIPPDIEEYDPNDFPHWHVFCKLQLGAPMPTPDAVWNNAEVIAGFSDDVIKTSTLNDFYDAGLSIGYAIP